MGLPPIARIFFAAGLFFCYDSSTQRVGSQNRFEIDENYD
jgi:hypothetical protein